MYPLLMKDPARSGYANFMVVDGNYFDAMGIPVERGRAFRSTDTEDAAHVGRHQHVAGQSQVAERGPDREDHSVRQHGRRPAAVHRRRRRRRRAR